MNAIEHVFHRRRVLLPVVHCCASAQARRAVVAAIENGADGVFLINQGGMSPHDVVQEAEIAGADGSVWVGVNLLGINPADALDQGFLAERAITGLWTDNAGVDPNDCGRTDREEWRFDRMRGASGWRGLYFGGVAFKYQREVPPDLWRAVAKRAARGLPAGAPTHHWVDVVTTSGEATGSPPLVGKISAMREALGDHPLAIASGITPDNVAPYLPLTDAFLVATGIEERFGVFDPARVRALADAIHGGAS